jgi:predicted phosphodiesterase
VRRAIISDIHSNLEALQAVLADARSRGADEIICLGDVIGYGPNPRECIDLMMEAKVCILGNHDQGALFDPEGFSSNAERAIFWTRRQIEDISLDANNARRWSFLSELPRTYRDGDLLFVHGSARNPLTEYVFPEDIYNTRKLERIFAMIPRHCFQGHTHVPGIFLHSMEFLRPGEVEYHFPLEANKVMINVGSVGQPRDGDPRACYVILEDNVVAFYRVDYPRDITIQRIYDIPDLDNFLGDRLRDGR